MRIEIYGAIVGTIAILLTLWQLISDKGRLKYKLKIVDKDGALGSIVKEKDHLMVEAINVGKRPLVLQGVDIETGTKWRYLFKCPYYERNFLDKRGVSSGGGSFEEARQIDPGHSFKMLLSISYGVLLGYEAIKRLYIVDSTERYHRASFFHIAMLRLELFNQRLEWRKKDESNKANSADAKSRTAD